VDATVTDPASRDGERSTGELMMTKTKRRTLVRIVAAATLGLLMPTLLTAAESKTSSIVTGFTSEVRNRAAVLLIGNTLTPDVATRLQTRWADEASFFRPVEPVKNVERARAALDRWLEVRTWHIAVIGFSAEGLVGGNVAQTLQGMVRTLQARNIAVVWCTAPASGERARVVNANDTARKVMRAEGVVMADLFGALLTRPGEWNGTDGTWTPEGAERSAATLEEPLRRALFSRSTPWAELPVGEKREPARLLADPQLLASPMNLPEAEGKTAMVYRAEEGGWQFNLHSFIAHHDGKFWAVWSSGRVDEDSSSQFIRYATSLDGLTWSRSELLAPDPDGERGPWRWMASGVYVADGKLFALGSLNQGNEPPGGPWSQARLIRFVWTGESWREDRTVADDCVVYFPPLRVEGRDFFIWRDSRAYFYTGYAPVGTDSWTVTRVPGPMPDYRMSETAAYVDAEGVVHMIIRDQGYTRRLYHSVSYDAGGTWTIPVKTNYPDAASKNMAGRLSNGWFYLISNPKASGTNARDPLAIAFSRDGWTYSSPMALRKNGPPLRFKGKAKGGHSFQYSHAIEHDAKLWVIYATNKEDIEVSAYPLESFRLPP
jgi:hypothetical protein